MAANALRDYLSHEFQDLTALSCQIYDDLGIAIKPNRLGKMLTDHYPDVQVSDGILIRIVPQPMETPNAPHPQPQPPKTHQRRRA